MLARCTHFRFLAGDNICMRSWGCNGNNIGAAAPKTRAKRNPRRHHSFCCLDRRGNACDIHVLRKQQVRLVQSFASDLGQWKLVTQACLRVVVRMVTVDSALTARFIAHECSILSASEGNDNVCVNSFAHRGAKCPF